jgi:hypothetical protein
MVVLVVISAFLSPAQAAADDFELPSYADYYDWALVPLTLFAAVVAPLLLCPDRRDGVLSLYAARPITPTDYVGSRWAAFLTVSALAREYILDPLKIKELGDLIKKGTAAEGMLSFDSCLFNLCRQGQIDEETALQYSSSPTDLKLKLDGFA